MGGIGRQVHAEDRCPTEPSRQGRGAQKFVGDLTDCSPELREMISLPNGLWISSQVRSRKSLHQLVSLHQSVLGEPWPKPKPPIVDINYGKMVGGPLPLSPRFTHKNRYNAGDVLQANQDGNCA